MKYILDLKETQNLCVEFDKLSEKFLSSETEPDSAVQAGFIRRKNQITAANILATILSPGGTSKKDEEYWLAHLNYLIKFVKESTNAR